MPITDFKINNYRSIKDVWLKLKPINVIVGPNGCGKSNMYRAMYLVSCAASGRFARSLAEEGGIKSVMWAGEFEKADLKGRRIMRLSVRVDRFEYNLACGPVGGRLNPEIFEDDPEIKAEDVFLLKDGKKSELLKRRRGYISARDSAGNKIDYTLRVSDSESVLTALRDPVKFPELFALRDELRNWRFYHGFRTDNESPLRRPQIGVQTMIMNHDGIDLAAALATIQCSEMSDAFDKALRDAFPESELKIDKTTRGKFKLSMSFPGFARPFDVSELSDGTLQYLCLLASLLSASPAPVIALNEPETSIHPNLYEPLARLLVEASKVSQIWITTHSTDLSDLILEYSGCAPLELEKVHGETKLVGVGLGGYKDPDEEIDWGETDDAPLED